MRTPFLALMILIGGLVLTPVALDGTAAAAEISYAAAADEAQQQPPSAQIDVDSDRGGAWYTNPVWIAIGVIALVVLILLIVMATRGGGTTIVRD